MILIHSELNNSTRIMFLISLEIKYFCLQKYGFNDVFFTQGFQIHRQMN